MNKVQSRETVSRQLVYWREKNHLTQKEVARQISIPTHRYQAYELSRAEPCMAVIKKLANFYHLMSIDQFLDLDNNAHFLHVAI